MKNLYFALLLSQILLSCSPQRNLVYFSNLSELTNSQIKNQAELKLQKNDQLSISLSSLNVEYDALFVSANNNNAINGRLGFRVNNNGKITLPRIGDIMVEGLSIEEAQGLITKELKKQIKEPVVVAQLINFKITVIGEVNRPASINVPGDEINLLEALGMAGDMTVYGKRENVLVIREDKGVRNMVRLNLNDKSIYESPYFQLKQNDIIYVEPDKAKEKEFSPNNRALPIITACISAVAVLATALIR
ncbi:polysaccharide biosynthesis/export family protein [Pedobacter heparinus]|uniref:polysaccharide biosynthesis/export family protein n=1 Tax=Pedobacter heparinus TaxID=984 RepID=UPI00293094A2|nr:polysaccharide biosynthesis/export family protein [Pedobacter heparinus]